MHVCQTYDSREKEDVCANSGASFRGKVEDLLKLIEGPWGSYGNDIQ